MNPFIARHLHCRYSFTSSYRKSLPVQAPKAHTIYKTNAATAPAPASIPATATLVAAANPVEADVLELVVVEGGTTPGEVSKVVVSETGIEVSDPLLVL